MVGYIVVPVSWALFKLVLGLFDFFPSKSRMLPSLPAHGHI